MQTLAKKVRVERIYWAILAVALLLAVILIIGQLSGFFRGAPVPFEESRISKEEMLMKLQELRTASANPPPSAEDMRERLMELRR